MSFAYRLYYCPSRRSPRAEAPEDDIYGTYSGGGWPWGKSDRAGNASGSVNISFNTSHLARIQ